MNDFRRVHRATPLLRFWTTILALFTVLLLNMNASAFSNVAKFLEGESSHLGWLLGAVATFAVMCVLVWWGSGIWWRAMGFRLSEEEVAIRSGVISTRLRTARYDRIQAVDVVEPVIARIFGVAKVRIETAGGNDSALEILYLTRPEAEQVRAEVLARLGGARVEAPADESPEFIPAIPIKKSLAAALLHPAALITTAGIAFGIALPGGLGVILPVVVGFGPWVWGVIDRSWQFTATLHDDALNISYGLADRRRQTIPLQRIHAVRISQPLLWRLTGWWQVQVSVAGYGLGDKQGGTTTLLPVGSREQSIALVALLSPLELAEIHPEAAPNPDYRSPRQAWWLSPIDRAQQAVTLLGERAIVLHSGRFGRRMAIIAPAHIQELSLVAGPIAHLLGLANVRFDLVRGPVLMTARQLDVKDAKHLLAMLRKRQLSKHESSNS